MTTEAKQRMLRLGLPLAAVTEAIAEADETGADRISLELPLALLRAAMPEVAGHLADGPEDEPVTIELEDEDFDVSGYWNSF